VVERGTNLHPDDVRVTSDHELRIIQFPALLEQWMNQFDNYDIWKEPKQFTKWITLFTVGPFVGHENAQAFEKGWTNIARGLATKIIKIQSLKNHWNREKDAYLATREKSDYAQVPNIKIYITPLTKEEHFTIMKDTLYNIENVFEKNQQVPISKPKLDATYTWSMNLSLVEGSSSTLQSHSTAIDRLKDLADRLG
jgi:hypothetical protein